MTIQEIQKQITWCPTIYASARSITLEDGYTITAVNSDGLRTKDWMDQQIIEGVERHLGTVLQGK